jgi:hypothetical protein
MGTSMEDGLAGSLAERHDSNQRTVRADALLPQQARGRIIAVSYALLLASPYPHLSTRLLDHLVRPQ